MTINCIVIDDEPFAIEQMEDYIKRLPFLNLLASFDNAIDSISFIKENNVDLIFLDIQMHEISGIRLLEILNNPPKIIFTTAYEKYAIKGYELNVVDYLLKPISFERFLKAANKVYDLLMNNASVNFNNENKLNKLDTKDFIFVKASNKMQKILFSDILYIEGMKDYLRIHTVSEKIMTLQSFKKIISVLPENYFLRIHKSFVISLNRIETIERNKVKIGEKLIPIGDSYKKVFLAELERRKII